MTTQNSGRTVVDGPRGGKLRPFPKGTSGNPGGRPKGFGAYLREQTAEGVEVADLVLAMMRNKANDAGLRLAAATWVADRAFGKPKLTTEVIRAEAPKALDLSRLTDEELDKLDELTRKATPDAAESPAGR